MSRGFVDQGYLPVAAVESDLASAASYAANFGGHVYAGDIAEFAAGPSVPSVDVVIGGPPCQGFSALGRQRKDDPRNLLWRQYVEVVRRARPAAFVIENVENFLRSGQFETLQWHCRRGGLLAGYGVVFAERLNAADYGAPQRRSRAIVIGLLKGMRLVAPQPTHGRELVGSASWRTVRDALRDVSQDVDGFELPDSSYDLVLPGGVVHHSRGPFKTRDLHLGRNVTQLSLNRFAAIPPGGSWKNLPDALRADCWRRKSTPGMGDVMGRLRWDEPSVTIRTEFVNPEKGRYLHQVADRPISLMEGALLMGFPEDHLWCGSKTDIARQIGNAVPPPLAAGLAASLQATLRTAGLAPRRTLGTPALGGPS